VNIDELLASLDDIPADKIPAVLFSTRSGQSMLAVRLLQNGNGKHPPAPKAERLLTAQEVADRTGFSTDWVYEMERADKLAFAIKFEKRSVRFSEQLGAMAQIATRPPRSVRENQKRQRPRLGAASSSGSDAENDTTWTHHLTAIQLHQN
jgi:predicted DNA-binding transcriptional regulator AlpA